ncbi:kinase-like domain-containing protein [Mycena pura]|uniref:non-specific serine/threonine protein kinase n=1 Tax=Mycena pura TaxID=153505 RepID=A0AAD6YLL0_9AGAR|nr:kinase-like domain-containing protein [Mycena pura]
MSSPSLALISSSTLIAQGAEAKVYKAHLTSNHLEPPVVLKHRFQKGYRHPTLDGSLTRARVAGEARALMKCLRSGVNVPGLRMVDATEGVLGIEWIEGRSVRRLLPAGSNEDEGEPDSEEKPEREAADALQEYGISVEVLMQLIGEEIAKMHLADVIHGDLTTSNMMLRHPTSFNSRNPNLSTELVLIDFGLSYQSSLVEDKAVDLYVLERAFSSTHPESEPLFATVLKAYEQQMGKDWVIISRRLDDGLLCLHARYLLGTNCSYFSASARSQA